MDRQTDQVSEDIILFQREYDEAHAEEEKILDNWINKSSLVDVHARAADDTDGQTKNGGTHIDFGIKSVETSIKMSTSTPVIRNIPLKPLPPRTPTTAGSMRSNASIGLLGIRGSSAEEKSDLSRQISTPSKLAPLRERATGAPSVLRSEAQKKQSELEC